MQSGGRGQGRNSGGRGNQNQNDLGKPSRVLLVQIENPTKAFSINDLNTIFCTYGKVLKIATFERGTSKQAFIMYEDTAKAQSAIGYLQGFSMFNDGACKLKLSFSMHEDIQVKKGNTDRQWDASLGEPSKNECMPGQKQQQNNFQNNNFQNNFQSQQAGQPRQGFQTDINDLGYDNPEFGDHINVSGREIISRHMAIAKHVQEAIAASQSKQPVAGNFPNQFQPTPMQNVAPMGGSPYNQMAGQQQVAPQQVMQPQQQFNSQNPQPQYNQGYNQMPANNVAQNAPPQANRQGMNQVPNPQFGQQPYNAMQNQAPAFGGQQAFSQA